MRHLAILALFLLVGCGSPELQNQIDTNVIGLEVRPADVTKAAGETERFQASAILRSGGRTLINNVQWSTSDPNVVTVDNTGLATAQAPGTATVSASAGGYTAQASFTVEGEEEPAPE